MGFLFLMVSLFVFFSCSKSSDENLTEEQKTQLDKDLEAISIDEKDFAESDADLKTVDYKEFYDILTPHGEWIEVAPEEIGMDPEAALSESQVNDNLSFSRLLGVNDAYASNYANVGLVYVWKPSADLGVTFESEETPVYTPYTNGQWVNTDAGWYFKAPTPAEETVSHYGRWVNTDAGWLWVPGRVWSPAWVDWRQDDSYVSWAPLPPTAYMIDGTMRTPDIDNNNYVIVERKYFLEPTVYKYNNLYNTDGNRIMVSDMSALDGIMLVGNTILNRGPDVNAIQYEYGRNIELVTIQHVRNFNDIRYTDKEYFVYTPVFIKYKHKNNKKFTVNVPKSYRNYNEWKLKSTGEYESKKENNGNNNGNRNNGNDNGNQNNNNGKNNEGKVKVKQNDNNNNGNNNKGNDNGKKINNNDNRDKTENKVNVKKNDNNNNGNKNKVNDNNKKNDGKNNNKGKK